MTGLERLKFDHADFVANYWQKRPLLIRDAISSFVTPLPADELAGLAMEQDVESRIIEQSGGDWLLHHGPFEAADFQREVPWTLLVQAVDHYVPEVAALRSLVDFLPGWRLDDIMVSYATDGGSVGPHYDNYDVFLLQGEGERLWRTGDHCDTETALLAHEELRILSSFEARQEFLLQPGDMLYLPPGVAHWGIARGECTTFSIGFRAPRKIDLVERWVDHLLMAMAADDFYQDPEITPVARPGEISAADLARAKTQLREAVDRRLDDDWFGELVSEPREAASSQEIETSALPDPLKPFELVLDPAARVFWRESQGGITVYSNGQSIACSADLLPCMLELCAGLRLPGASLSMAGTSGEGLPLLEFLLQTGGVYVE